MGLIAVLALCLLAAEARAGDGRIEINQARALAGGVTPGDTADFPVTISAPGSYVLTSDLSVTDPADHGIEVLADGVAIDLNGFEITGPVLCSGAGSGLSCGAGAGRGIQAASRTRMIVHEGRIRGFGSGAVAVGERAVVRDLIVRLNGGGGIATGARSVVTGCSAVQNTGLGIFAGDGSVVASSNASAGLSHGVVAGAGSSVSGCAGYRNGGIGINVGPGSVVREGSAYLNGFHGIFASTGSLVSDVAAYQNGGHGIEVNPGGIIQQTSSRSNTGFGLNLVGDASYRGNTITLNTGGTVSGGVNMGANTCNVTPSCP
jgi:hypothetical protein